MKLWILSHLKGSPGNRRVLEAAREAGHAARLVDPAELSLEVRGGPEPGLALRRDGRPIERPELVFTRLGGSAPGHALDTLLHLKEGGVPCVNRWEALLRARDKVVSFQLLAQAGIPLPTTVVLGAKVAALEEAVEPLGPAPWIVKLPRSTQGLGVARVDSLESLRSVVDMLRSLGQRVLVQHYVRESSGMDIRVLVVGGRAVAAMRRQAPAGEVRSNLHRGGSAEEVGLTPFLADTATAAAAALGLDVAGVDLLPAEGGPVVAEVNASPGLQGLEEATGRDLAAQVVAHLDGALERLR
jgi:ribosomal protein S6--L-glutamate ligase